MCDYCRPNQDTYNRDNFDKAGSYIKNDIMIILFKDKNTNKQIKIKYCPFCGDRLTKTK